MTMKAADFLNKLEQYIIKCRGCRTKELGLVINRQRPTVNHYLSMLVDQGRIYRINRDGHWQYYASSHDEPQGDNVTRVIGNRTVHYGTQRERVVSCVDAMHSSNSVSGHRREGVEYA